MLTLGDKTEPPTAELIATCRLIIHATTQAGMVEEMKTFLDTEWNETPPSARDTTVITFCHALGINNEYKRALTKHCREEEAKTAANHTITDNGGVFDMDSVSGRAKICKHIATIFIRKHIEETHPIKCISGKLMKYKDGIYEESPEESSFMSKEIKDIGEQFNITMPVSLIDQAMRLIGLDTLVRADECEPDKENVIVLNNGVLDVRTWVFRDFDPDEVYFSKIPVDYNLDAAKPTKFYNFIDTCFKGNEEQKALLQEIFGYTLTKTYKFQDVFYFLGEGGNGKGSMMSILKMMLSEDNCTSFSLHQLTDGEHIDYNIAMMKGKHANICGDVGTTKVKNTETLKKLSSNTDLITGRNIRERPFQFINYAKMIFLMNRAPKTDAHTTGDTRRIRMIDFINKFSEEKDEIKDIHRVITDAGELPGILLWAIEGLQRLEQNQKFTDPKTIAQRGIEYDMKSDTMRYFVSECIEEDPCNMVPCEIVYEKYYKFAKAVQGAQLGQRELKREFLAECKEASWNNVMYVQQRKSAFTTETISILENDFKLNRDKLYVFKGISIVREEPQKTIVEYAPSMVGQTDEAKHASFELETNRCLR